MNFYAWKPYVPVAARKNQAAQEVSKLKKKGQSVTPVVIEGRTIAKTFWGKAWCDNLERYSDFETRLPRGRTYVRNGSVIDLKVGRGQIDALVSGSEIYTVKIKVAPIAQAQWHRLCKDCAGGIDTLVELLQGRLAKSVMERVCQPETGLFPAPKDIELSCSCYDWADMCKHVAAVFYGVGARLDASPDMLFTLRGVDHTELVARAGQDLSLGKKPVTDKKIIADEDIASIFGLEMAENDERPVTQWTDGHSLKPPSKRLAKKQAVKTKVTARTKPLKTGKAADVKGAAPLAKAKASHKSLSSDPSKKSRRKS